MQRIRYTDEQRTEALRLAAQHGKAEAARLTGISAGTIGSWATRAGVSASAADVMRPAIEANAVTLAQRKQALASGLLDDVARLRAELFAPVLERKVTVAGGVAEIVDVAHTRPSSADQKHLMVACAVAIDKVQILTGGLTASIGVTEAPEPLGAAEQRQRAVSTIDELAARRTAS